MVTFDMKNTHKLKAVGDKEAVAQELLRLYEQHGKLTAELVVEAARDPDSPLHSAFTWDDAEAARERRLEQARSLIRSVVILKQEDKEPRCVFVNISSTNSYVPTEVVVNNIDMYLEAWEDAKKRVMQAEAALRQLEDAARKRSGTEQTTIAKLQLAIDAMLVAREAVAALH